MDYYKVLGIDKEASESEIKIAYKRLAKIHHPDLNESAGTRDKFIEIQKAYEELLNPPEIESIFISNIFGIEIWDSIVRKEDFDIPPVNYVELKKAEKERNRLKKICDTDGKKLEKELRKEFKEMYGKYYASNSNDRDFYKEVAKLEPFANYYNALRKCSKIEFGRFKKYNWAVNKIRFLNKLYGKIKLRLYRDKINITKVINYLERVLNNEVDIKEKIPKPIKMKGYNKFEFDIQNQFHPKFINKFPVRIQIFLHNKIRNLIKQMSLN